MFYLVQITLKTQCEAVLPPGDLLVVTLACENGKCGRGQKIILDSSEPVEGKEVGNSDTEKC